MADIKARSTTGSSCPVRSKSSRLLTPGHEQHASALKLARNHSWLPFCRNHASMVCSSTQTLMGYQEGFKCLVLWALELFGYLVSSHHCLLLPLPYLTSHLSFKSQHDRQFILNVSHTNRQATQAIDLLKQHDNRTMIDHVTSM